MDAWLDRILQRGRILADYYGSLSPDDAFGWGKTLRQMWFPQPDSRPTGTGVLLVGPEGCGKHTAAAHLIRELMAENRGYALALLRPEDLPVNDSDELHCRLTSLLGCFLDRKQGLCLILEQLLHSPQGRKAAHFLGEMLCLYCLRRPAGIPSNGPKDAALQSESAADGAELPPLFLAVIEESEKGIPALLRSRLQLCRMTPPDEEHREAFINSHYDQTESFIPGHISTYDFLQRTEGLSYAQLEDLVNSLDALCQTDDVESYEAEALMEAQLPPKQERRRFMDQVEQLLTRLPEALQRSAENAQPAAYVQPAAVQNQEYAETERDYENESGYSLASSLNDELKAYLNEHSGKEVFRLQS